MDDYRAGVNHRTFYGHQYPAHGKEESGTKAGIRRAEKENPGIFTMVSKVLRAGAFPFNFI